MRTSHRYTAIAVIGFLALPVVAQSELRPFTLNSTVNDFALECQHPIKKSHGPQRSALCISYVNAAVLQVALAKASS